jgi:hypothetical protein
MPSFQRIFKRLEWVFLLGTLVCLTVISGWGLAIAVDPPAGGYRSVDPAAARFQEAQALYVDTCSACHIPLPAEVLPTETWRKLLEKPEVHYGVSLNQLISVSQLMIWNYLNAYSRPLNFDEPQPLYVAQSRYFKALHPRVELPKPINHRSCVICHPGARQYDYQTLNPQWDEAP